ncbi:MAG: hypothetical protein R3E18_02030 [Sphingomonadaceae bacterium]
MSIAALFLTALSPCGNQDDGGDCGSDTQGTKLVGSFYPGEYAYFKNDQDGEVFSLNLKNLEQNEKEIFYDRVRTIKSDGYANMEIEGKIDRRFKRFGRPFFCVISIKYNDS